MRNYQGYCASLFDPETGKEKHKVDFTPSLRGIKNRITMFYPEGEWIITDSTTGKVVEVFIHDNDPKYYGTKTKT